MNSAFSRINDTDKRKWIMRVNVTTLLIIFSIMQVSATSFAQKITLSAKNEPLAKVFADIRKQTGYDFVLTVATLNNAKPVSIKVKDLEVEQVLKMIFEGQPLDYRLNDKSVVVSRKEPSFLEKLKEVLNIPIRVDGVVTDSAGNALPGATVKVKGQSTINSDSNGKFSFSAEVGTEVTVSFVGYEVYSFKVAEGQGAVSVVLKMISGKLEEVVVNNGYQKISKERATGSYDYIDEKKLNEQVGPNILDRLKDVASGIVVDNNLGSRYQGDRRVPVMIRGLSTINGDINPLVVVDNFPYYGDLRNINPNNVSSITILKDAAAASIWGSQAGNGVIVITTKKGMFNQKAKVSINTNTTLIDKPDLFAVSRMNSSDFIDIEQIKFNAGLYNGYETYTHDALSPVVEILIAQRDHKITDAEAEAKIKMYRNHDVRTDQTKYLYEKAINQQYAFNINGGSNVMNYYLGLNLDYNKDALNSVYQRINVISRNTFKITSNLEITTDISYTPSKSTNGKNTILPNSYPYQELVTSEGTPLSVNYIRKSYTDTAGRGKLLNWDYVPLEDWKYNKGHTNINLLTGNIGLRYQVINGLNATLNYRYERQANSTSSLSSIESYSARDLINKFTQIDPSGYVTYGVPFGGISTTSDDILESQTARAQLSYERSWGKHNIAALVASEISGRHAQGDASTLYGFNADPYHYTIVDYLNTYPTFLTGEYQQIPGIPVSRSRILNRALSVIANAAYTYDERITISGSARKDGANIFGVNTNNKWKPLWSSGISWELSKEHFYPLQEILPYLKLRTTYGYSGNSGGAISGLTNASYYNASPSYNNLPYAQIDNFANPELQWETVNTLNFGLDFGTKNNRISGSLDYFSKRCTDLFGPAIVDVTTGISQGVITKNVAKTYGNGFELVLNSKNITGPFSWNSSLLFNHYTDQIKDYYRELPNNSYYLGTGGRITPIVGQPIYSVIAYKWAGLNPQTGAPRYLLNGQPSEDYTAIQNNTDLGDLAFKGSSIPQLYGSISNSFSYKRVSFNFNISYKLHYYFTRSNIIQYGAIYSEGTLTPFADYASRWQKPGDEKYTDVPAAVFPATLESQAADALYGNSSANVLKGDHVRLQYVNLSYEILSGSNKTGIKSLRCYLNASNLGILWKANKNGIDPDYNGMIPAPRTWSLGLNMEF